MKKFILGFIVGILLVFGTAYCYFYFGFAPVAAADKPMPMETYLANRALRTRMFKEAPTRDVSGFTTVQLVAGADVYQENCAFCHGLPDQDPSSASQGMFPDPPQLFTEDGMVTSDRPGLTYWKVKNGIRLTGMPGFRDSLTDEQMWDVTALVTRADKLPKEAMDVLKSTDDGSDPPDPPADPSRSLHLSGRMRDKSPQPNWSSGSKAGNLAGRVQGLVRRSAHTGSNIRWSGINFRGPRSLARRGGKNSPRQRNCDLLRMLPVGEMS